MNISRSPNCQMIFSVVISSIFIIILTVCSTESSFCPSQGSFTAPINCSSKCFYKVNWKVNNGKIKFNLAIKNIHPWSGIKLDKGSKSPKGSKGSEVILVSRAFPRFPVRHATVSGTTGLQYFKEWVKDDHKLIYDPNIVSYSLSRPISSKKGSKKCMEVLFLVRGEKLGQTKPKSTLNDLLNGTLVWKQKICAKLCNITVAISTSTTPTTITTEKTLKTSAPATRSVSLIEISTKTDHTSECSNGSCEYESTNIGSNIEALTLRRQYLKVYLYTIVGLCIVIILSLISICLIQYFNSDEL